MKELIQQHLKQLGTHEVIDLGVFNEDPSDYPDIAREVGEKVLENGESRGVLICGTGIGVCMAANKMKGIRAALCTNEYMAEMSRKHNDANVLCMGGRVVGQALAISMVDKFLGTDFLDQEEKYVRRVAKMEKL